MRIKKIKIEDSKVFIEYQIVRPEGKSENYTLETTDKPLESFRKALQGLVGYIGEICELPDHYCNSIKVRGVSFSYGGEKNVLGATITGLKSLNTANSPLTINTPHLPSEPYSPGSETYTLPSECYYQLLDVQEEAVKFIEGDREADPQQSLFNTKPEENIYE